MAADLSGEWEDLGEEQFRFEKPGDELVGILLKAEKQGKYNVNWYTIESQDKTYGVLGSQGLDRQMVRAEPGDVVRICLVAIEDLPNGQKFKVYKVSRQKMPVKGTG